MKKILLFGAIIISIGSLSCKKNNSVTDNPPETDSTNIFTKGFVPSTAAELNALGFVEDLDSSSIQKNFLVPQEYIIPNMPPIANQSPYNACAPFAVVYGMLSRLYRPVEAGFTASPFYVWNKLNKGKDTGLTITEIMKELSENGAPSTSLYTTQKLSSFLSTQEQTDDAARHTIAEYHPFKTLDRNQIKGFLYKNYPLPFGVDVGYNFEHINKIPLTKGRIVWKTMDTKDVGGHGMLLIGYSDSLHAYRVQNSWNPTIWGEQGYVWIDYDLFEQVIVKVEGIPQIFWATPLGVTTNYVSNLKATTATVNGFVQTENGQAVTQRGICWSDISQKPRTSDLKVISGSGTGNFSGNLTALKPNTKYWVRAFATKASGLTIYGIVDSLITTNIQVAENGQPVSTAISFSNNVSKNFTLLNIDGSPATPLNYNLVSIGNNSNNAITVTKSNTGSDFSIKLATIATGSQTTTFNVFYDSKLVQNISVSDITDSTAIYTTACVGWWTVKGYDPNNPTTTYT